jgi:hypothetical protein
MPTTDSILARLEYLRGEITAERISYGEVAELQGLAEFIDPSDTELLQWADVPEFADDPALDPPRGLLPPVPVLDALGNAVTPGRVPGRG